jgi:hypothetical protein
MQPVEFVNVLLEKQLLPERSEYPGLKRLNVVSDWVIAPG